MFVLVLVLKGLLAWQGPGYTFVPADKRIADNVYILSVNWIGIWMNHEAPIE